MFKDIGRFFDSREISKSDPYGPYATFHNWGTNDMKNPENRLDYIFVKGRIQVISYGVLSDTNGVIYPSDHYPILIKTEVKIN